jgi:lysophospholipase L1-like esterase
MERVRQVLEGTSPAKWVFYGDSITHGALHTFGQRDYAELFAERLRFELGRTMDLVITSAISGDNTRGLLESFDWRVGQLSPDVVLIMIGMNDCSENNDITLTQFGENLDRLIDRLAQIDAIPVLQTTCPILPGLAPDREPYLNAYMDAIRVCAADRGVPLVDHTRLWQEHADKHPYWMSDAFHPNEYGHRAFADLLYRAFGIHDKDSHACRLYFP